MTPDEFRLEQSMLNRRSFSELTEALVADIPINATSLSLSGEQLEEIKQLLPRDDLGRLTFRRWNFRQANFGPHCDFGRCRLAGVIFDDAKFEVGATFAHSSFTRARFNDARFGNDARFEYSDLGIRGEFHSARFGHRARFAHASFKAAQFFAASFGDEASFARAQFARAAKFRTARFGDRANFTESGMAGFVDFAGASFGSRLQMIGVDFVASPTFQGASFGPRARLLGWDVKGSLEMRSAHFSGDMTLHGTEVGGNAAFDHAHFGGSVDFGEVRIGAAVSFAGIRSTAADRFGPIECAGTLSMSRATIGSACLMELRGALVDLSDLRLLAPVRIELGAGDVVIDRLDTTSRLVLTASSADFAASSARLISARGANLVTTVVSGLDVRPLRLDGAEGIDGLRIESGLNFEPAPRGPRTHRQVLAEEHRLRSDGSNANWDPWPCRASGWATAAAVSPGELARIYRGLRKAREDGRDAPGAADFYYGEMEMRRLEASRQFQRSGIGFGPRLLHGGSLLLLQAYRFCGGYGVRPSRPLLLFLVMALATAAAVDCANLIHYLPAKQGAHALPPSNSDFEEAVVFVFRSALLLPTSARTVVATGGEWIQIGCRVIGPVLIGLFAFGLRARVHR